MKSILLLSLTFISVCSCTRNEVTRSCTEKFKYDANTGTCKNCKGEIGFNPVNFVAIRKTKNAECLYLSKLEVLLLLGDSVEIPNRFAYNKLTNYNFKGSVLDSCRLFFNFIENADLRGTDLTSLLYGYAMVTGVKDNFTKIPANGIVTIKGDSLSCEN